MPFIEPPFSLLRSVGAPGVIFILVKEARGAAKERLQVWAERNRCVPAWQRLNVHSAASFRAPPDGDIRMR